MSYAMANKYGEAAILVARTMSSADINPYLAGRVQWRRYTPLDAVSAGVERLQASTVQQRPFHIDAPLACGLCRSGVLLFCWRD
jgi:hypothetical protein